MGGVPEVIPRGSFFLYDAVTVVFDLSRGVNVFETHLLDFTAQDVYDESEQRLYPDRVNRSIFPYV